MAKEACFQSRQVKGVCDVCGEPADLMHLPLQPLGFYCERHCPACSTQSATELSIHRRFEVACPIVEKRARIRRAA
jgi:hypothetical protein